MHRVVKLCFAPEHSHLLGLLGTSVGGLGPRTILKSSKVKSRYSIGVSDKCVHLHACERVHRAFISLHPDIERLPLLHHNTWRHRVSRGVHKCAILVGHDASGKRQKLFEGAVGVLVLCSLVLESSSMHEELHRKLLFRKPVSCKLYNRLPCRTTTFASNSTARHHGTSNKSVFRIMHGEIRRCS